MTAKMLGLAVCFQDMSTVLCDDLSGLDSKVSVWAIVRLGCVGVLLVRICTIRVLLRLRLGSAPRGSGDNTVGYLNIGFRPIQALILGFEGPLGRAR